MGRTIGTDQTGAVQCKHHGQILQRHIVDQLVIGALQKGGIDGHDGLDTFAGHAACKSHRMLLGDAHVVVAAGKALMELHHARAFAHGRCDAHQTLVLCGHVAQPLTEDLGEGLLGRRGRLDQAHAGVELAGAVIGNRVCLGQLVALTFFRNHMQKLRALQALDVFQRGDQRVKVMAINGADVVEAELLEHGGRHDHALGLLLQAPGQLQQGRHLLEHALAHIAGLGVELTAHQLGQIAIERAHGRADAHVIVVEDDQQIGVMHAAVVQRLEGHAGRHRTVADHGNGAAVLAFLLGRQGHAQGRRDAGGRVGRAESVVLALHALGKARQTTELAQRTHAITATGQDLVRIGLVAHIPDDAVIGRVEHRVQRHRQLHRAQIGAQMAARLGDAVDHIGAQLCRQGLELGTRQAAHGFRIINVLQQRISVRGHDLYF